ncbi:MAG: hypothetical protein HEP71_17215 [Roseivirga sp.]|nr:hypothetical protein [Roseivirga sp.]
MKVLITNIEMDDYSGTTLYVKELALGLKNAGIQVEVFTFRVGVIGEELQSADILVSDNLKQLTTPDIIHAHHNLTAWPLLFHFKDCPMVFWVHNRLSPLDMPPLHRNIMAYMAVDYNCKERYTKEHDFAPDEVIVIQNWVNTHRFHLKAKVNTKPAKALVFSNYAREDGFLPAIREACERLNIELQVMGRGTGTERLDPENYLGAYDLVFAKAKAAMEAMASGCAVCVCDFTGLAGLVQSENYKHFRRFNFGMKLMTKTITAEAIAEACSEYERDEVIAVTKRLRKEAGFEVIFAQILPLYETVISRYSSGEHGRYQFTLARYLKTRKVTFRIWAGLWTERHVPILHRFISKTGG